VHSEIATLCCAKLAMTALLRILRRACGVERYVYRLERMVRLLRHVVTDVQLNADSCVLHNTKGARNYIEFAL